MSSGVTIVVDEVTPLLDRLTSATAAQGVALVGARAVASLVKEHLYGLDGQRHRGGRHFYRQAGDSVSSRATPQGAAVSITQTGFRQRLFGGTIVPRVAKLLAIPASPEAYGMRPREFHDLEVRRVLDPASGAMRLALVRRPSTQIRITRRKGKDGTITGHARPVRELGGEVMFWLVRKVTQQADSSVLPYDAQMSGVAVRAMQARIERLTARQSGDQSGGTAT